MPGLVMPCYTVVRQSTDRVLIHSYLPKFVCFVLFSNDCMAGKNICHLPSLMNCMTGSEASRLRNQRKACCSPQQQSLQRPASMFESQPRLECCWRSPIPRSNWLRALVVTGPMPGVFSCAMLGWTHHHGWHCLRMGKMENVNYVWWGVWCKIEARLPLKIGMPMSPARWKFCQIVGVIGYHCAWILATCGSCHQDDPLRDEGRFGSPRNPASESRYCINNLMVAGISLKDQKFPLFFYKPKWRILHLLPVSHAPLSTSATIGANVGTGQNLHGPLFTSPMDYRTLFNLWTTQ